MIIIADSGSTKTQWRIIEGEKIRQETTLGINPYLLSEESIIELLKDSFLSEFDNLPVELFYYGTGCKSQSMKDKMSKIFLELMPSSIIDIQDDLLGAARAVCKREEGIVSILGTGSNSCYYNGEEIIDQVDSLGYILGDEGSGSYMGKRLLGDYLRGKTSSDISEKLEKRFSINRDFILKNVYETEAPNRFLASFGTFILQNRKNPYIAQLIISSLNDFFEAHILTYKNHKDIPCHFVGSIAFYFADYIRKVAKEYGIYINNIVEDPIAGLTLYHTEKI